MNWNKAQNLCSVKIRSAQVLHDGEILRFLTLSTAEGMNGSIKECWHILLTDIKRLNVERLLNDGYLKESQVNYFYGEKERSEFMTFSYMVVHTSEGVCGVLHILFYGDFIPQKWLSDRWHSITGTAFVVSIEYAGGKRFKSSDNLSKYVISQYVSGQSKFIRSDCSRDFVFEGFARSWELHKRTHNMRDAVKRKKAYRGWYLLLKRYLLYGEWGLVRNIKVSEMKSYCDEFGCKIVGI